MGSESVKSRSESADAPPPSLFTAEGAAEGKRVRLLGTEPGFLISGCGHGRICDDQMVDFRTGVRIRAGWRKIGKWAIQRVLGEVGMLFYVKLRKQLGLDS